MFTASSRAPSLRMVLFVCLLMGCSKGTPAGASDESTQVAPAGVNHHAAIARLIVPQPEHVAIPMPILARRLKGAKAGEVLGLASTPQKLAHVGFGQCLDGWALLGYAPDKSVFEMVYIPGATLPKERVKILADEHPLGESVTLMLAEASADVLRGQVKVQREGSKKTETWTFKTKPEQLAAANNIGHMGCHHTGFARLSMGSQEFVTPARSQFIAPDTYRISVALNDTHRVEAWFNLPVYKRKPNKHRITADLAKLLADPNGYEQRVIFEHIDPRTNLWVKTPASAGELEVTFEKNRLGGPVLFQLNGLKMETPWPEFKDALDAHPLTIKGLVGFSTDRMGRQIPIHRMPTD